MVTRRNIRWCSFRGRIALAITLLVSAVSHQGAADDQPEPDCLRLGANTDLGSAYDIYGRVIEAIYRRAGICARSTPVNPLRQSHLIAAEKLDGVWLRYEGYEKIFDANLVPVPQPIFYLEAVFVRRADSSFTGELADLEGRQVAFVNGLRWIESHLPHYGAVGIPVPGDVPIVSLLRRGRFDVYATHRLQANDIQASLGDQQSQVVVSHWDQAPFMHFLHKRHADKLDRIAAVIREAIAAGDMNELYALPGVNPVELD